MTNIGAGNRARTDDIQLGKLRKPLKTSGFPSVFADPGSAKAPAETPGNHPRRTKRGHGSEPLFERCYACGEEALTVTGGSWFCVSCTSVGVRHG